MPVIIVKEVTIVLGQIIWSVALLDDGEMWRRHLTWRVDVLIFARMVLMATTPMQIL